MKNLYFILLVVATLFTAAAGRAAEKPDSPVRERPRARERFLDLFQPFRSTTAAISPDGRYLAYSVDTGVNLKVVTVEVDKPTVIKTAINLGSDATPMLSDNAEKTPVAIEWLQWVTPNRLVIATNSADTATPAADGSWRTIPGAVIGVDADGGNYRLLVSAANLTINIPSLSQMASEMRADFRRPDEFRRRSFPMNQFSVHRMSPVVFDFYATEPNSILLQARYGMYYRIYSVNVLTGKLKQLDDDIGERGLIPMYDRQGKLRGGIYNTFNTRPPFDYVLAKDALFSLGRWRSIDKIAKSGGASGFSVSTENFFGERSIPIGFDENPDILYFASNIGKDTYGLYSMDVKTGKRTEFAYEDPAFDVVPFPRNNFATQSTLVFDRYSRQLVGIRYDAALQTTHWLRSDLKTVQSELESAFPGRNVGIQGWDRSGSRYLVLVDGVANPGSFVVYEPATKKAFDMVRRATWADKKSPHRTMNFAYPSQDGRVITGLLTFPNLARFATVPVIVQCPSEPWQRTSLSYQAETMAFAEMGFAVVQIDSAGAWGFGTKNRQAITKGYEQVIIDDITTTITALAKRYRINPQRVALVGEGYGGYVALRGLQLQPEKFRCAAVIDAPLDLANWMENDRWTKHSTLLELTRAFYGDEQHLREAPLFKHPEKITKPVCLLAFPGPDGGPRSYIYLETRQFASALRRQGTPVDFNEMEKTNTYQTDTFETASDPKSSVVELDREFAQRLPHAQAAAYRNIEYFLNAYIYEYQVRLGPLKPLPQVEN